MDHIDGTDVAHLLDQKYPAGMPVDLVLPIVSAVASALDYAHRKGLLHRDIKPANIIVADLDTDDPGVFLADFGIARPLDEISGITTTNMTVGTVAYAAPEQLMGEEVDGRADQYALAATAYHLLTGAQLFPHSNPAVVISRHLNTVAPMLTARRQDCASLDDALQVALAKDPHDRFPSCSAFAHTVADALPASEAASASATTQAARITPKRVPTSAARSRAEPPTPPSRRAWIVIGSVAAIMLLIGVVVLVWRSWGDSRESASDGATSTTVASPPLPSTAGSPPAPAPPPPAPAPTVAPAPTMTVTEQAPKPRGDQAGFLAQARTLPSSVLVTESSDCRSAPTAAACATDANVLALGRQACKAMDLYPHDSVAATRLVYPYSSSYTQSLLMIYAANYLCPEHANMWEDF